MIILFVWGLSGFIGYRLGVWKGRPGLGLVMGLLGPIGWVVMLVVPDDSDLNCQECRGRVNEGASRCCHCGSALLLTHEQRVADAASRLIPAGPARLQ